MQYVLLCVWYIYKPVIGIGFTTYATPLTLHSASPLNVKKIETHFQRITQEEIQQKKNV